MSNHNKDSKGVEKSKGTKAEHTIRDVYDLIRIVKGPRGQLEITERESLEQSRRVDRVEAIEQR